MLAVAAVRATPYAPDYELMVLAPAFACYGSGRAVLPYEKLLALGPGWLRW